MSKFFFFLLINIILINTIILINIFINILKFNLPNLIQNQIYKNNRKKFQYCFKFFDIWIKRNVSKCKLLLLKDFKI